MRAALGASSNATGARQAAAAMLQHHRRSAKDIATFHHWSHPMLSFFRRALSSWVILGLLGLIMIAFIITGFGTGGGGLGELGAGPERLASVGSAKITEQDLRRRLDRELKGTQQEHPDIDMPRFIQAGAYEDVLEQEIIDKSELAFAEQQGITASKRMIDAEIATIPVFQNAAGQFDEANFRQALNRLGLNEADLRQDVLLDIVRRQMLFPMAVGPRVPSTLRDYFSTLLLETRTGAVAVVPIKAVPGPDPTEPEIAAYFKAHQARYTIPERRILHYAPFGWNDVVGTVKATDAEIEAAYKAAGAKYGPKETRNVAQLTLPDQAAANAFVAKVKAGKGFATAASEAGFAAGDIVQAEGTRDEVARKVVPQIADAAFKAGQGATVGPIRSPLGWHVARVEKVTQSAGKTLAAAHDELAAAIQQRKAAEVLDNLVTRIEDEASNGANFNEIVNTFKLKVVDTQPITATGVAPGTDYQPPAEAKALLKSAFDMDTDSPPQVETIAPGQSYAVLSVRQTIDPTVPPLAQVHDRIKADMIAERSAERAKKLADQLVAQVNAGTPLREAMSKAGTALPPVQPVTMRQVDAMQAGERLPPPVRMMFTLPKGKARAMAAPNGAGWFIVTVESVAPADAKLIQPLSQQLKQQFDEAQRAEYAEQFIRSLQKNLGVKRNPDAIARLKRKLQTGP
jgi:peptidyl-prolyl cis-trans isomerase D